MRRKRRPVRLLPAPRIFYWFWSWTAKELTAVEIPPEEWPPPPKGLNRKWVRGMGYIEVPKHTKTFQRRVR